MSIPEYVFDNQPHLMLALKVDGNDGFQSNISAGFGGMPSTPPLCC